MRFPARTAALLAALIVVVGSTLATTSAVPAQASSGSAVGSALRSAVRLPYSAARLALHDDTPGDATMLAREGLFHPALLSTTARKQASVLGTRPSLTGEQVACSPTVPICVHYATSGTDAPTSATWVTTVMQTLEKIYGDYQRSGYRMPEPDGTSGTSAGYAGAPVPANDIDIYLANIGSNGYYGYCSPDRVAGSTAHDTSAFCVLDNDFAEFPNQTPEHNLDVTAAHEFFHAVQFAYDATEDPWFMEGTAAWMESYEYPQISDNTQYLRYSPLRNPGQSLDKDDQFSVYGAWIFFRWISEHRPELQGQLPKVVLTMWQRAAATGNTKDRYSLQAVKSAMKSAGLPMKTAFAKFAAANRDPKHTYAKGAANHYPVAKPASKRKMRTTKRISGSAHVDHLAASTVRFVPKSKAFKSKHTKLRLTLDMAAKAHGSSAVAIAYLRGGGTKTKSIHLSKAGKGAVKMPFSKKKVKRVELTLANASTRMHCWNGGNYSCNGQPKDMSQLEKYTAQVRR